MHALTQLLYKSPLFVSALLGGVIFTSCASAPGNFSSTSLPQSSGDRLVDLQARLTNLRKTEENLQKIMDRAGSVKDVLSVAQQLSSVRESIEQIDAQLKNLQNQVAYSTITLNLEAAVSSSSPQRALGSQIQETWNNSTNSVGAFTVGLMKLGIWLIVYTPYLLILAAGGYGFIRWRRTHSLR